MIIIHNINKPDYYFSIFPYCNNWNSIHQYWYLPLCESRILFKNYARLHTKPQSNGFLEWVAEVMGGIGILIPFTKTYAAWGLILLLIAVFPANIDMFLKAYQKQGWSLYTFLTLLRLPLQFVLIYWVYWSAELKIG